MCHWQWQSLSSTLTWKSTGADLTRRALVRAGMVGIASVLIVWAWLVVRSKPTTPVRDGIELVTFFPGGEPYDRVGDPVCLGGVWEPIGQVIRVERAQSTAPEWKVTMSLDKGYVSETPSNAIVVRRWRGFGLCNVDRGSKWDKQFEWRGRFLEIECPPALSFMEQRAPSPCDPTSAPPIKEHAVLASEVDCCGGIVEFLPRPWWEPKWWQRFIDFVEMKIGVIWVELALEIVMAVNALLMLVWLALRRRRASS
jgi:hypothetical protein